MNSDGLCFPLSRCSPGWPARKIMSEGGQCGAVPDSLAMLSSCTVLMWVTPHPFWPLLVACAFAQISSPFTYKPSKQRWKADTAPFEVRKNFAIHLQDQRSCIFQASHSEIPTGVVCSCFSSEKSSSSILSLKCCRSRVPANSTDVLKLSRERRCFLFCRACVVLSLFLLQECYIQSHGKAVCSPIWFFSGSYWYLLPIRCRQPFDLKLQCQCHFVK